MNLTFNDLSLKGEILKGLEDLGFEKPTPIQEQAIPHLLESDGDLIALAQTGTGKTATFSLPILNQIDTDENTVQAIILTPTRELCLQICRDIESFSKHMPRISTLAVYGGTGIREQIRALSKGVQIVVGTPGRTLDLIERRKLKLGNVRFLVLDEADEMLSMGFQDSLNAILDTTPDEKQTILFSATMPKEIRKIAKKYMTDPHEISVIEENKSTSNVSHEYYMTLHKNRYKVLKRLADFHPDIYSIVFCRTRRETQQIADKLMQDGYSADCTHGDLSQAQRDQVMQRFREKKIQMLVATDVAARGIDVNDLTHVINYQLPDSLETYVHRSGRTGRANKHGICITIINAKEGGKIRQLEKKIEKSFEQKQIPEGSEICRKRLFNLIDEVEKVTINEEQISEFIEEVNNKLEWMSREDLIKRFVSVEFNRFLEYYSNAGDLNVQAKSSRDKGKGRDKRSKRDNASYTRYFINLGKDQKVNPKEMITLINQSLKGKKFSIGAIDLQKNFSFFEVEEGLEELVISRMRNSRFRGRKINVEIANPMPKGRGGKKGRKNRNFKKKKRR